MNWLTGILSLLALLLIAAAILQAKHDTPLQPADEFLRRQIQFEQDQHTGYME